MARTGRPRQQLNEASLVSEYIAGRSESWLSAHFKVSRSSVHRRLVSAGVPLRGVVEASNLLRFKIFTESEEVLELLDGLLLGDASVGDHQASEARLEVSQRRDRRAWLDLIEAVLRKYGIESSVRDRKKRGFQLRTLKYVSFTKQRHRWYPRNTKTVPLDVRVGPVALAHWYWGDGSTGADGYRMVFNTQGFSRRSVDFLRKRLREVYGWRLRVHRNRKDFVLAVGRKEDRVALVDLIKPHCPPCFTYKLNIRR